MTFNFKELLARAAFDYVGPVFTEWWNKNSSRYNLPDLSKINAKQLLGAKYFMTLKLGYKGQFFEFPNEPLISLSLNKTIVETATVGKYRRGSVLEYISTENYQITIKVLCVDQDNPDEYPASQVQVMNEMFAINDALDVVSNPFFEMFGIRKIVLKDKQVDEMKGSQGLQGFTFTAIENQDFYADLNDKEILEKDFLKT
ncbi:DUF6046 domain-containing protein [Flavobacterium sp.]|uniref:DUF6046 domain-containing protein n=1 Tax=Flavobacterium sp. TaxID=239 RepID=UPI003750B426